MKHLIRCLLVGSLFVSTAFAEGTRIVIRSQGSLPDPEALVQALEQPGGEHEVRVRRVDEQGQETLTLDLWGATTDSIEQTLRAQFQQLASAQIDVTTLDEPAPKIDDGGHPGRRVIIKKEIRDEPAH